MNRKDKGLLPYDPEYCDKDWNHMMKGSDDMVDYSLKDFKKWLDNQSTSEIRALMVNGTVENFFNKLFNDFEEEQEKTPRYIVEKGIENDFDVAEIIDTKHQQIVVKFIEKIFKNGDVFDARVEAEQYAEYLNKKE